MNSNNPTPLIASIHNTAMRCQTEGIGLTESALRRLVKSKAIPSVMVGNKALINWDVLMHFLECGNDDQFVFHETAIRRLGV